MRLIIYLLSTLINLSCTTQQKNPLAANETSYSSSKDSTTIISQTKTDRSSAKKPTVFVSENLQNVNRHELVSFAKTLIGIPYKYASTDPAIGFDCSGFITYIFQHFNIAVPRSSYDFTYVGTEIERRNAVEGDLILFTGTSDSSKNVGHMGIITDNTDSLRFIHSTSGKAYSVTISSLTAHYEKRFVKIIRLLSE